MLVIVATVRTRPGMAARYARLCAQAIPRFRAANPGMIFYTIARSHEEPDTFRAIEAYEDEEALRRHMASALLRESMAELRDCIAEVSIERHDALA